MPGSNGANGANGSGDGSSLGIATDRDLVVAFQAGDPHVYDEIYHRYEGRVRRICSRILMNPLDVDEAAQETFLKAYQALGRFNGSYQLGAWLARIASNVCVDHVRGKVRAATLVSLTADHETMRFPLAPPQDGPEDQVVGNDPRVDAAIGGLAPLHAEALKLRALGGLSHEEMAGRLAMTPAQVKALLHRARTSFKKAWDRAEGWALAPFAGVRRLFGDRSEPEAGNLIVGPTFGPMLAERVATSAVIVVVALTGAPGGSFSIRPQAPAAAPATDPQVAPHRRVLHRAPGAPADDASQAERTPIVTGITSLLGETRRTLEGHDVSNDDDGDDGGDVGTAETRSVVKKVRRTVERVVTTVSDVTKL